MLGETTTKWSRVNRFISLFSTVGGVFSGACAFLLCLTITSSVMARYVFNKPFMYIDDIASYLLIGVIFPGLAYTLREGGHIRVEVFVSRVKPQVRTSLQLATAIIALVWGVSLLIGAGNTWVRYLTDEVRSTGLLEFPLWIPGLMLVAGAALLLLQLVAEISKETLALRGVPKGGKPRQS